MESFCFTVRDHFGLHARPAGALSQRAGELTSKITIHANGRKADCKRLFDVMGLGVREGDMVCLRLKGEREREECALLRTFCERSL